MPLVREAFTDFRLTNDPGDTCPESGHPLKLRMGKAGLFIACSGYPECTYTVDIPETEEDPVDPTRARGADLRGVRQPDAAAHGQERLGLPRLHRVPEAAATRSRCRSRAARPRRGRTSPTGEKCPVCGHDLVKRHGRFGEYVSCSNYPDCRYKPPKPVTLTGVTCPECDQGEILERKGRFGPFYGCSRYPECTRNFRARPVPKPCPKCGTPYLLVRERKAGAFYVCEAEGCGFDEPADDLDRYPVTTEVTEEARQAALAAAVAPVPKKRAPRRKPAAPAAEARPRPAERPARQAGRRSPRKSRGEEGQGAGPPEAQAARK